MLMGILLLQFYIFKGYVEFFRTWIKWSVHIIEAYSMPYMYQVHVIHTWFSYRFIFEVMIYLYHGSENCEN